MGRDGEGGMPTKRSVFEGGAPPMVWKMVYGRKGEIIQQGTETVSLSLKMCLVFFFFVFGDPVP